MGDSIFSTIENHIYIKNLTAILRDAGTDEASATSAVSFLRNELHKPVNSNYITERYSTYCHQYRNGHLSLRELEVHLAFLARHAQNILKGKLSKGSLSQPWALSQGFHPAFLRLATLANPYREKVQPIDAFSLQRMAKNNYLFFLLLLDWICHHRGIANSAAVQTETNTYTIALNAGAELQLAYHKDGHISGEYSPRVGEYFLLQIYPEHIRMNWDTGKRTTGNNFSFEMEELIAKMHLLGPMKLSLPLLDTPTTLSA